MTHADESNHLSIPGNTVAWIFIEAICEMFDLHAMNQLFIPVANSHLQEVFQLENKALEIVSDEDSRTTEQQPNTLDERWYFILPPVVGPEVTGQYGRVLGCMHGWFLGSGEACINSRQYWQ